MLSAIGSHFSLRHFPGLICRSIDLHLHSLSESLTHSVCTIVTSFSGPFCCIITYAVCLYHGYIIPWPSVVTSLTHSVCTMVTAFPGPFCCCITYTFCLYHRYIISWITVAASLTQSVCTIVTSFPGPFCCSIGLHLHTPPVLST